MKTINNVSVLIIATNGFEEVELFDPLCALTATGAKVTLASLDKNPIHGIIYDDATGLSNISEKYINPDITISEIKMQNFDALILPGGVINPDKLRMIPQVVNIVRQFVLAELPVASICHGPWLLVEADVLKGKQVTGWYSIRKDLSNAGAEVLDKEVVVDGNLITSRMPSDIPAFIDSITTMLTNRIVNSNSNN